MSTKVPRVITSRTFRQGYAQGVVVAKHHPKTVRVAIERRLFNRKYEAHFSRRTLYHVHDELDEAALGDVVVIRQSRPHSKQKHFEVVDIAQRYAPGRYLAENPEIAERMAAIDRGHGGMQISPQASPRKTAED